ncbi:Fc.00g050940.m01.CDS01 [Cosmosporella sp. VM-42]
MLFSRLHFVAALLSLASALPEPLCVSESQPNPIKNVYPQEVTGLLNATLAIAAIPLPIARKMVPYPILESAYRQLLPDFPKGMYPVLVQAAHDHDINYLGTTIPDFSRVGYEFPFLDLLGDGYSSFRWAPEQFITASNLVAIQGSQAYGTVVHAGTFSPQCDAYNGRHEPYFKAKSVAPSKFMSLDFSSQKQYPVTTQVLDYFKNVTNQPSFADGKTCDQMIRFFNTSVTEAPYAPVAVKGGVRSNIGPFHGFKPFDGLRGIQVATAFIERNYLECSTLKGI